MRIRWLRNSACRNIFKKRQGVEICGEWCLRPRSGAVGPSAKPVICRALPWFVRLEKMNVDLVMNLFCCFFNVMSGSTNLLVALIKKNGIICVFAAGNEKLAGCEVCKHVSTKVIIRLAERAMPVPQHPKRWNMCDRAEKCLQKAGQSLHIVDLEEETCLNSTRALCKVGKHLRCNLHAPENMSISKFLNHMGEFDHIRDHQIVS